jgi:hypothetical protein
VEVVVVVVVVVVVIKLNVFLSSSPLKSGCLRLSRCFIYRQAPRRLLSSPIPNPPSPASLTCLQWIKVSLACFSTQSHIATTNDLHKFLHEY